MAGGNFSVQNKVRPGAYINFKSSNGKLDLLSSRGIVTIPLVLKWGQEQTVIEITKDTDIFKTFGFYITDSEMLLIKEAMKRAVKILVYRVNEGVKASGTISPLTITAKHSGLRGNDISVSIVADADDEGQFFVNTYMDSILVDKQKAANVAGLVDNDYVTFSGTGTLIANSGISLSSGTDGIASTQDYTDYLTAIEAYDFNTMAVPVSDSSIKALVKNYIIRQRNEEGKKVQAVLADYATADHEGIISVKNGVILEDGTSITKENATIYVAAMTAGAEVNKSSTYDTYDEAVGVPATDKYTNTQIETYLSEGHIVFVERKNKVIVEQDINTLHTFTLDKTKEFAKNRVIRCLDAIGTDVKTLFEDYFIGKVDNNEDGRNLFKSQLINYFEELQRLNAIQNFDTSDLTIIAGASIDSVSVELYVQPVDAMEKLYMNVNVEGGNV